MRLLGLAHRHRPRRRGQRGPHHRSADAPAARPAVRGPGLARERQRRGTHCQIQRAERRTAALESLRSQADHGVRRGHGQAMGSDAVAVRTARWRPDLATSRSLASRGCDMDLTNDSYVIVIGTKNFTECYYRDKTGWLKVSARGRKFRATAEQVLNHVLPAVAGIKPNVTIKVEHRDPTLARLRTRTVGSVRDRRELVSGGSGVQGLPSVHDSAR